MKSAQTLMPPPVLDLLTASGVGVSGATEGGGPRVRLEVPAEVSGASEVQRLDLEVRRSLRPIGAAALTRPGARPGARRRPVGAPQADLLLVLPRASAAVRRRALELGICLIALNPERASGPDGVLVLQDGRTLPLGTPPGSLPGPRTVRPPGEAVLLVVRALLLGEGGTQQQLADRLGISQARVSQVFADLNRRELLERGPAIGAPDAAAARSWRVADVAGLLDLWLQLYPGPGGVTTYWFGLAPAREQVVAAIEVLRGNRSDDQALAVSGQPAADLLAPWALPRLAVVHARVGTDLRTAGLTPCPAVTATLALTVPSDRGVWAFPDWYRSRSEAPTTDLPLADPVQVLADLQRSPGPDAVQSTAHFRQWLLPRLSEAR